MQAAAPEHSMSARPFEPEDVSAKFENGILQLHILKKEAKKVEKKDNRIAIEG